MYPASTAAPPRAPRPATSAGFSSQIALQQTSLSPRTTNLNVTPGPQFSHTDDHDDGPDLRHGIDAGDPLTARGRVKKRLREKESFDPDDPDRYRYKSYHIRRAFDLFGHLPTIINDGIKRRAKEAAGEDASTIQTDQDYETFNLIVDHLDGLNDDFVRLKRSPKEFRALVRKIREAADQARNNDTANLKKDIACMLTPDGSSVLPAMAKGRKVSSKHDRGFDNDIMGRYLCPISLDWDDMSVRSEIKEGKHAILACDWPRLLYADCDCNMDDLEQGLGRNMALVRVVKYLFTGRSAAFSETAGGKTTRSGNAALAGMKQITPRVVAYAACMLRYAISNEESWSTMDREFNMHEFYWHVVSIFNDSDDFGRELLAWFNMKVFGTSLDTTMKPQTPAPTAALSVLKSQRQAKRAAKRVLGDVTNNRDSQHIHRRSMGPESEDEYPVCIDQQRPLSAREGQHEPQLGPKLHADLSHGPTSEIQVPQMTPAAWTPSSSSQIANGVCGATASEIMLQQTTQHGRSDNAAPQHDAQNHSTNIPPQYPGSHFVQERQSSPTTFYARSGRPSTHDFMSSLQNRGAPLSNHSGHSTSYLDQSRVRPLYTHVPPTDTISPTKAYVSNRPPAPPWSCSSVRAHTRAPEVSAGISSSSLSLGPNSDANEEA